MTDQPTETLGSDADMSGTSRQPDATEMSEDMSGAGNVADAGGERSDGRPVGVPSTSGHDLEGRPAAVRHAPVAGTTDAREAPTVAPEEEGETPATEHAPGADL